MVMTLVRVTLVLVGTAAYLGLAVLGWGGFTAFFSRPPLIALAIVTFALAGAALFAGGSLSSGEREDRGNRWVIVAFGLIGLLDGYLPAYTDRSELWTADGDAVCRGPSNSPACPSRRRPGPETGVHGVAARWPPIGYQGA